MDRIETRLIRLEPGFALGSDLIRPGFDVSCLRLENVGLSRVDAFALSAGDESQKPWSVLAII